MIERAQDARFIAVVFQQDLQLFPQPFIIFHDYDLLHLHHLFHYT